MGYPTHKPALIIPAAKIAEFNTVMERQGYGPNWLNTSTAVAIIGKGDDAKTKAATHYAVETRGDASLVAAIRLALKAANDKLPKADEGSMADSLKGKEDIPKLPKVIADAGKKIKDATVQAAFDKQIADGTLKTK